MKVKELLHAKYFRLTCEAGMKFVYFLLTVQDMDDLYRDEFGCIIPEAETQRCYHSVSVSTGYHLYGDIGTKNTFHMIISL